jgi:Uma2 family endonuclease
MATVEQEMRNLIAGAAPPVYEPDVHRLTVDEYVRIVSEQDLGRVELIDGVIYDVSPQMQIHIDAVDAIYRLLMEVYPDRRVRPGGSVRLGLGSLWEPDVVVTLPSPPSDGFRYAEPAEVLLVVEVAVSTWSKDTRLKLSGYARAGIPEVWIIDPKVGGKAQRHTGLAATDDEPAQYSELANVPLPGGLADLADLWTLFSQAEVVDADS